MLRKSIAPSAQRLLLAPTESTPALLSERQTPHPELHSEMKWKRRDLSTGARSTRGRRAHRRFRSWSNWSAPGAKPHIERSFHRQNAKRQNAKKIGGGQWLGAVAFS